MLKPTHIFAFSLGAGLTVILMLFLGYQLDGDMGLCKLEAAGSIGETPATCLRSWLGALSGWVAAAGALGVGVPTIVLLKRQLALPIIDRQIARETQWVEAFAKIIDLAKREIYSPSISIDKDLKDADFLTIRKHVTDAIKRECSAMSTTERERIFRELNMSAITGEAFMILDKVSAAEFVGTFWLNVHNNAVAAETYHSNLIERKERWRDNALLT